MLFVEPVEKDYLKYRPYLCKGGMSFENTFLNTIMWKTDYAYEYALTNGALIMRISEGGNRIYSLPIGGDFEAALDAVFSQEGGSPTFFAAEGAALDRFLKLFENRFEAIPFPENFEYIYSVSDLSSLPGKKYHQKRNHISAFSRKYNWHYESLSKENSADAVYIAEKWAEERNIVDYGEIESIKNALSYIDELHIVGGLIYVDKKPAAFTFGAETNECVFDVTTEKALSDFSGAYAVINNEFAKHELSKYRFINREDDLGIDGLRRSKLSYHPTIILKKYLIKKKAD